MAGALTALARRYQRVGVVSGRPVAFLRRQLGDDLYLSGVYGLEVVDRGRAHEHPEGRRWRATIGAAAEAARAAGLGEGGVEDKGLSLTLHYRTRPDLEQAVRAFATAEAARRGLEVRPAKSSVELHPPLAVDKGTALAEAATGLAAVCFFGDDVGDLPAFAALDRLHAAGVATLRVGVRSEEAPAELLERADLVVDGPAGVLEVLRRLGG